MDRTRDGAAALSRARARCRGDARSRRLRAAVADRVVSEGAGRRRDGERGGCACGHLAQVDGAGIHATPIARRPSAATAPPNRTSDDVPGARRQRLRRLPAGGRRPRRAAGEPVARRTARAAEPDADHPPRLRRGLERDREVEGRAARRAARGGAAEAGSALRRVPLRRSDGRGRHRISTTRASISRTRSIRRRSSPTR